MFCLYLCMCTACIPSALGSRKTEKVLMPWELQMVVSCYVGFGSQTRVVYKSNRSSKLLSHLSRPKNLIFKLSQIGLLISRSSFVYRNARTLFVYKSVQTFVVDIASYD